MNIDERTTQGVVNGVDSGKSTDLRDALAAIQKQIEIAERKIVEVLMPLTNQYIEIDSIDLHKEDRFGSTPVYTVSISVKLKQ
jgi:hypothetical protein